MLVLDFLKDVCCGRTVVTGSRNITWAIVGDSNNILKKINTVVVISVLEVSVHGLQQKFTYSKYEGCRI